ncbi:MAG: GNAT family N-acetyltransferase [Chlorobi bacterium]|nr:GNAT family N-acetyltransferase [Chlorobiota bacterium]
MAMFYDYLSESLQEFIAEQHIFFVATAPTTGRVSLSPKGINTFRCLDATTVMWLDLTGSGNETAAHVRQNGRVTVMFCSFTKIPRILRLYGNARVIQPTDAEWGTHSSQFPSLPGIRQIFLLNIQQVQTSCGFGVPLMEFRQEREMLAEWAKKKGEEGLIEYRQLKNSFSIDGIPADGGIIPGNNSIQWHRRRFDDITARELYDVMNLRQRVFTIEQNCIYLDADYLDIHADHLLGKNGTGELIAYLRIVHPGKKYAEPSIGRVITAPEARRIGLGKELMEQGMAWIAEKHPNQGVRISAQHHLERFYMGFGFRVIGEPYDEDGIPHVEMVSHALTT